MSHSETYTDTGITTAFYQGYEAGEKNERERITRLIGHYQHKPDFTFANLTSLINGQHQTECKAGQGKFDAGCTCGRGNK